MDDPKTGISLGFIREWKPDPIRATGLPILAVGVPPWFAREVVRAYAVGELERMYQLESPDA